MELPRITPPGVDGPREGTEANPGAAAPAPGAQADVAPSVGAEARGAGDGAGAAGVGAGAAVGTSEARDLLGPASAGAHVSLRDVPQAGAAKRLDSMLAVLKSNTVLAGGRLSRAEVNEQLLQLAGNAYSEAAQQQLVHTLERQLRLGPGQRVGPDEATDLGWVAKKLREAVPEREVNLDKLTRFFREQGFRLRWFDQAPPSDGSYQLDRNAFREALRRAEAQGEPLDRRGVLRLLAHLQSVRDPDDLAWAQWQLQRRVQTGRLSLADGSAKSAIGELFADRCERPINAREIGLAAFRLRKALTGGEAGATAGADVSRCAAAVERCISRAASDSDPDAIFYARRVLDRELAKAARQGADVAPLRARFAALIAPSLEGRVDRYTLSRSVERLVRDGAIGTELGYMLRAAIATSNTTVDLSSALRSVSFQAYLIVAQAMREAWEQLMETFRRNATDDLLDSHGNVIETAFQRYMKRLQRELDQKVSELRPLREREQRVRAQVGGSRAAVRSQLAGENDPSRRASLEARDAGLAAIEAGIKKVQGPQ